MNTSEDSKNESDEKKTDHSGIPMRPEDTDASGDALNGTGEDNHSQEKK